LHHKMKMKHIKRWSTMWFIPSIIIKSLI